MASETCTIHINQTSTLFHAPFMKFSQYTVTGSDMSTFKSDWEKCKEDRRKSGEMWSDESQLISDMEKLGYEFESNNYDVIDVDA